MKFLYTSLLTLTYIVTFGIISASNTNAVVVPNQFTDVADFGASSPLDCTTNGPNGVRIQTLFPANQLHAGVITGFGTRLFPGSPGFGPTSIPNITIKMSTTSVAEGNLNSVFANNVGPDETIVFQGTLFLGAEPGCNTNPCPFPQVAGTLPPFPYNPANGNLLVEFIIPPCVGGVPSIVSQDATDDLQRVFAADSTANEGDPMAFGLITEFSFANSTNIPTLSEWGLIAMAGVLGIVGFLALRRRKAEA